MLLAATATRGLLVATTAVRLAMHHFLDICIHFLFKICDHSSKLTSDQTFVAAGTGGITFLEPFQRLEDRLATVGAVQSYICMHYFVLLNMSEQSTYCSFCICGFVIHAVSRVLTQHLSPQS